jgi:hypothetical protein
MDRPQRLIQIIFYTMKERVATVQAGEQQISRLIEYCITSLTWHVHYQARKT